MKLLSFATDAGPHVGAKLDDRVIDLTRALAETHPTIREAGSLLAIVQSGIDIDAIGGASIAKLKAANRLGEFGVANPKYLPPILRPSKILALALNYQEHIDESKLSFYNEPIIFEKYPSNMIGHGDEIELPPFPQKVDEEHELALVVGRACRHIRPTEAADYIFGYTICNDVSARDRQGERLKMGQPYSYAKNFATFCPIGPWVVTRAELPDARNLDMEVKVNGESRRKGNSKDMIFDPYETLAYCSDYTPMEPGDVISLGTFAGNKRIAAGDEVELIIDKIGTLKNKVVNAKAPWRNFAEGVATGPLVRQKK
jgi:2-keto-4-pentenoate hydratase/2-oxohepta-3-ene-1,7-dioic acid hydratase in catechol pathway